MTERKPRIPGGATVKTVDLQKIVRKLDRLQMRLANLVEELWQI